MEVVERVRAEQMAEVRGLLEEYFEVVGVVQRDSAEDMLALVTGERCGVWVARVDGRAAGCVAMRPVRAMGEDEAECKRLYVREAFRGRGLAHALLDTMEKEAQTTGVQWMYLDSTEGMTAALRVYEQRGYRRCERYNTNPQAEVFLRKRVGGDAADISLKRA